MILTVLIWITLAVAAVVGLLTLLVIGCMLWASYYLKRLYEDLPIMTWLSVDDVKQMGIPEAACEMWLPELLRMNIIGVRPKSTLTEREAKRVARSGFMRFTIGLHEFRILHWPSNRKRFPKLRDVIKHFPDLEPPALPA